MPPPPRGAVPATVPGLVERVPPAAALAAITALGLALRLWGLGGDSLWVDEGYSAHVARLPLEDVFGELADHDTHPPLHYLLLHGWITAFGDSEWALRSLSALLGAVLVPVVHRIGALLVRPNVGLLGALFVAVSPLHVRFSQEARMYSLLALLAALSFLLLARLLERRTPGRAALYVVAAALLLYTHVWGLFVLLAQAAVVVLDLRLGQAAGTRLRAARAWAGIFAATLALYSPWLVVLARQTGEEVRGEDANLDWIPAPTPGSIADTARLWVGPVALLALAVMALAAVWLRARGGVRPDLRGALERSLRDRDARILVLWLAVPLAVPLVVSLFLPIYRARYTIAPSVPLYLLLAIAVLRYRSSGLRLIAGSAITLALLVATVHYHAVYEKEDWRSLARHVDAAARPGDLVLFGFPLVDPVFGYYSQRVDIAARRYEGGQDASFGRRLWYVRWRDDPPAIPPALTRRYEVRETRTYTGKLELSLLERRDPDGAGSSGAG